MEGVDPPHLLVQGLAPPPGSLQSVPASPWVPVALGWASLGPLVVVCHVFNGTDATGCINAILQPVSGPLLEGRQHGV